LSTERVEEEVTFNSLWLQVYTTCQTPMSKNIMCLYGDIGPIMEVPYKCAKQKSWD